MGRNPPPIVIAGLSDVVLSGRAGAEMSLRGLFLAPRFPVFALRADIVLSFTFEFASERGFEMKTASFLPDRRRPKTTATEWRQKLKSLFLYLEVQKSYLEFPLILGYVSDPVCLQLLRKMTHDDAERLRECEIGLPLDLHRLLNH